MYGLDTLSFEVAAGGVEHEDTAVSPFVGRGGKAVQRAQ